MEPDIGEKNKKYMKKLIDKNSIFKGSFGEMQLISDFLPSTKDLVLKEGLEKIKVTMSLNKGTVDFFKSEGKKLKTPYQRMIRNLLNEYVLRESA